MKLHLVTTAAVIALCATSHVAAQTDVPGEAEDATIVVTGQRAQQLRAIELKRQAIGVTDVAAADEIGRLPDRNVAEVIERLPGVGVTYDQGEGRYVAVRGVPSDLNGYTVNGIEIGNPDGQTRALPLDVISGQLLNRVEVAKAKTADMDGQGIGGAINLVTQTAFDFRDPFALAINAQAGYQELNDKVPIRGDVSVAGRFGADEQFGLALGASYSDRTYTSYGFYPDDWRSVDGLDFARGGAPLNTKFTDYSLKRERIGATGSFDWRPTENHQFYVRGIYSKFTEDEYRQRYRLDFMTDALIDADRVTLNPDGLTGTVTGTANTGTGAGTGPERRQDLRLEHKEKSVLAGMVGGSSRFDALTLDYVLARVHNEVREPNQLWQFRCNPGTVDFDFSGKIFTAVPRTECDATQMNFRQYSEQNERGDEDIWQGRIDGTYRFSDMDGGSFLKFGAKYRSTDKDFDSANTVWTRGTTANRFTLAQFDLAGDPVNARPISGGRYLITPTIDLNAIRAFTAENLSGSRFVLDEATSLANDTLNDFVVKEKVLAGYVMADLAAGSVHVIPGLRFERTKLKIRGLQLDDEDNVTPLNARNKYNDWLPSLIVRIEPASDVVLRLAYTRSIGRPNYAQLSPGGTLDALEETLSSGNPDLKPYRAHNLDASAEWYFAKGGLVSVGVFAKYISNPIFTQSVTLTDVTYGGQQFARLEASQPLNADKGDIVGIELAFQQQFTFLPGLLSGLGIELNATFTDSTLKLPDGRVSSFPQQSRHLYGAQLFYQRGPVEASVAFHNTGYSLLTAGDLTEQDQYNDDLRRLDAKVSVEVIPGIHLFAEGQNLTDEPTRQYQAGISSWVIQNERYGRTFYGGVSAKF